jgi:hypothetical protein
MKKRSCTCFGSKKIKQNDVEKIRETLERGLKCSKKIIIHEKLVGYDDIPVYTNTNNTIQYQGRSIRLYYIE